VFAALVRWLHSFLGFRSLLRFWLLRIWLGLWLCLRRWQILSFNSRTIGLATCRGLPWRWRRPWLRECLLLELISIGGYLRNLCRWRDSRWLVVWRAMGSMVMIAWLASHKGFLVGHHMRPRVTFVSVCKASPTSIWRSVFARVPIVMDLKKGILLVDRRLYLPRWFNLLLLVRRRSL
jgi:hypothetical protein